MDAGSGHGLRHLCLGRSGNLRSRPLEGATNKTSGATDKGQEMRFRRLRNWRGPALNFNVRDLSFGHRGGCWEGVRAIQRRTTSYFASGFSSEFVLFGLNSKTRKHCDNRAFGLMARTTEKTDVGGLGAKTPLPT